MVYSAWGFMVLVTVTSSYDFVLVVLVLKLIICEFIIHSLHFSRSDGSFFMNKLIGWVFNSGKCFTRKCVGVPFPFTMVTIELLFALLDVRVEAIITDPGCQLVS